MAKSTNESEPQSGKHDSPKVIIERFLLWGVLAGLWAVGIYSLIQFIGK